MNNTNCCVCFEEKATIPVSSTDSNEETIISKLRKLVSEVIWKDSFTICPKCLKTLGIVVQFWKTCIRSSSIRLQQEETESERLITEQCLNGHEAIETGSPSSGTEESAVRDSELNSNDAEVYDAGRDEDNSNCNVHFLDESVPSKSQYEGDVKEQNVFICFHCNKPYKSKVMLAKHIRVKHDLKKNQSKEFADINSDVKQNELYQIANDTLKNKTNKKFICVKCEKSYKTEKVMLNHMATCDAIKRHSKISFPKDFSKNECGECGRFYTTEKNLKAHMKQCEKNGYSTQQNYKCHMCDIHLKDLEDKFEHVLKEHNLNLKLENTCQICYEQFLSKESLQSHEREDHDTIKPKKSYRDRSYSCEVCSRIFGYVKEVIQHCVEEHQMNPKSVKPYQCNKCSTRFTSSANLIQHKQYHVGERSHICSYCGKSFITKSDLTVHEYTHLNRRNYKCEICDKAFNTNKNLRSHKLVVHTDSSLWKYQCNLCDKKFPLKCGYDQHIRRHSGDKRFKCLICDKSFVSSSELGKHKTFHSDERAFKCSHCSKEYKDRRVYEVHLTKVHGIGNAKIPVRLKKFVCTICPLRFFDKQKLTRHMCTHTGIKPFLCNICEKRFSDKSYLKHHLKVVHNLILAQSNEVGKD